MNHRIKDIAPIGCLRELKARDADLMLEWMNDPDIANVFSKSFKNKTKEDVLEFISDSKNSVDSLHFAIVDPNDEYMGTISLKNIDYDNKNAEYAISMRSKAHGTGLSYQATRDIIQVAFEKLNLNRIYLNVRESNSRAIGFYRKFGFIEEGSFRNHIFNGNAYEDLLWFGMNVGG